MCVCVFVCVCVCVCEREREREREREIPSSTLKPFIIQYVFLNCYNNTIVSMKYVLKKSDSGIPNNTVFRSG